MGKSRIMVNKKSVALLQTEIMPSAIVKGGRSTQRPLELTKPIQPSHHWLFDNALALLQSDNSYLEDSLVEFLLSNKEVLFDVNPFTTAGDFTQAKELSLRNILYSISDLNFKDSQLVAKTLQLNQVEITRIVSSKLLPEKTFSSRPSSKSKLHDDNSNRLQEEKLYLLSSIVLKERRTILKIVIELLHNKSNPSKSQFIQNLGKELFISNEYLSKIIDSITDNISILTSYSEKDDKISNLIYTESLLFIIELHKVLIELLLQNPTITSPLMKSWFESSTSIHHIKFHECFDLLKGLSTIISLLFIDLDNSFDSELISNYFSDPEIFKSINDSILQNFSENSIISYSWSIILLRKSIYLSEIPNGTFTDIFSLTTINNSINVLSSRCEKFDVFQDLKSINELLNFDNIYPALLASVITAAMPLITLDSQNSEAISSILSNSPNSIVEKVFNNEASINTIILARTKFPLLLSPYLHLASINGNFAYQEITEFKSYMSLFQKSDFDLIYKHDDENSELVKLTKSVDVYPPYELDKKLSLVLGVGTKAKLIPTGSSNDVLVSFLYKYNGWAYLGRVLQNISKLFSNLDQDKKNLLIAILKLVNKVIEDTFDSEIIEVLDFMSLYTDDSDILEVIFRLFEQGLHARDLDISEITLNLLTKLVPIFPQRILPYIAKSSLLSHNGKDGFASIFFGAIEIVNGDYKFTVALVKFTDALVQNFLIKSLTYPFKSKSSILLKLVKHLINVFESFSHNKFNWVFQKLELGVLILDTFSSILAYAYRIDEEKNVREKVTSVLAEAAESILQSFTLTLNDSPRSTIPIIGMVDLLSENLNIYEVLDISSVWYLNWIKCAFSFSSLTIKIRSSLNLQVSSLEKQLFKRLPELVLIYAQYSAFKTQVIDVITTLTNAKWQSEPKASLLSHLGRDNAQTLLHTLVGDLTNSFNDYSVKISIYDFICSVFEGEQQGLAVLFVSGRDVFSDFTKKNSEGAESISNVSVLSILKKNVRDIKYLPNEVSVHLLDAIALAFNSWITVKENLDDNEFINDLISTLQSPINEQPETTEDYIRTCYELKVIGKVAEILALFLFTTNNTAIQSSIINLLTSEQFAGSLIERFTIKRLKSTLNSNTQLSFYDKFKGSTLSDFEVIATHRNRFGIEGIYNLELMDKMFQNDDEWLQAKERIIATSVHQQYIATQISVAKPLGALLVSFSRRFNDRLAPDMLDLVLNFLQININEGIPDESFQSLFDERIQISFYIMYSLFNKSEVKKDTKRAFEILKSAVDLLSGSSINYFDSLAKSSTESTSNYRSLLRIIFCTINLLKDDTSTLVGHFSVFRQIFEIVICKSTTTLLVDFQNEVYLSRNTKGYKNDLKLNSILDDMLLILSILKIFVDVNSYANLYKEIAVLIEENEIVKALLCLYSLSHEIEVNDEFIFAKLSLMYIQELVKIEAVAEKVFAAGLFVVIIESPISSPIRDGGITISTGTQYHNLWTNGVLPLFISSLSKLGPNIVPETCLAIQIFGKQTESCVQSWERDSSSIRISSAGIAETSQILILYDLLKAMNVAEYLKLRDNQPQSQEEGGDDVDMSILPGIDSESKRENFVNKIDNLLKHPKFLATRIQPSSIEEQKLIELGGPTYDEFVKGIIDDIRDIKDFLNPE